MLKSSGPVQTCNGIALPYQLFMCEHLRYGIDLFCENIAIV
jgi:hypothetical protein